MKRIALLLAVVAMTATAMARVPFDQRPIQRQNNRVLPPTEHLQGKVQNKTRLNAAMGIPDGEMKTYKRSGKYLYVKNGYLYQGFQTDKVDIVYADNHVVYIKNILCGAKSYFGDDFWVQGTINDEGTEITVPLGQTVYTSDEDGAEVLLAFGSTAGSAGGVACMMDDDVAQAVYAIDGERISFLGTSGLSTSSSYDATGLMAYWSDDDSWTGLIECNTVLTQGAPLPAPEVITEIPDGCQTVTYIYKGECLHSNGLAGWSMSTTVGKIDVAFADDGSVYVHNPLWRYNNCNTWVRGTFDSENGVISVPAGQYLAWSDKLGYGVQLKWGSTHIVDRNMGEDADPQYELAYTVLEDTKQICYRIDGDKLVLMGSESDIQASYPYNYEATSVVAVYSDNQMMDAMEFGINARELSDDVEWTTPEMPEVYYFYINEYDYMVNFEGFGNLYFNLPETDLNGNTLDPMNLSYSVYLDYDELLEFNPDIYEELLDWTTEIPYEIWNLGYNFGCDYARIYGNWYEHHSVGLQVHHTVNGVKYSSDLCFVSISVPTGTDESLEDKTVSCVRYYNMMGQEITAPAGLTIKVTTYTDGTTRATKLRL